MEDTFEWDGMAEDGVGLGGDLDQKDGADGLRGSSHPPPTMQPIILS